MHPLTFYVIILELFFELLFVILDPELLQERERLGCKRLLLSHLGREVLARQEKVSFECAHDGYVVEV